MTSLAEHTADLLAPPRDPEVPFGAWTSAVRRSVMSFQFDCDRPRAFAGMIRDRSLGGVDFVNMACAKHAAYRDHSAISAADAGFYVMTLQLSGELRIAQDDRVAVLKPGLFAIYDSSRPAALTASDDYKSTCIRFPKERLGSRNADPLGGVTATAFEYAPGLPSVVWDMLISLNRNLDSLGAHGAVAVHNVMDLVSTMLRTELGGNVEPSTTRRDVLLQRIREYIDDHLGDPELGPAQIAAAHYISLRHLHNLFEQTDSSVARWIRTRRIELCQRDLSDPAMAGITVSAIAAHRGFTSPSHFGQVFKRETGQAPTEYRHQAMANRVLLH
ncbi:helix-turn-helix domain-containing protein [Saccharopolyspora sp. K220]|uniref:AraC-like ligand-binding domain-containing protein n=1 Tax=Saccharopolyspora soli TaxID=2926618 RepID=UPI001F56BEE7|nr:helix-turn-helix domain-containing protein [Saccharopolyspora soli]MCI2418793.1 helix-turn-helix domain-containing protein [Saccharopolyspora soli]